MPNGSDFDQLQRQLSSIPNFGSIGAQARGKLQSQVVEGTLTQRALSPFGFTDEQLQKLLQMFQQQIGASQALGSTTRRQALVEQPQSVKASAQGSSENQALVQLANALTAIQGQGVGQQGQLASLLLNTQLQREQIESQNRNNLFQALSQLGIGVGTFLGNRGGGA